MKHPNVAKAKRQNRFIVLISSYKQDHCINQCVATILGQTYHQRMFDVVVISDHQDEMTNMNLAQYPITLLTPNFEKSTKAKALQYAIMNLPEFKIYDAVVVLDADNIVEPEFLERVNDAFENAGTKAIVTHRLPKNMDTTTARMDAIFEEINTSIFRRGHITLGLSSALSGSGTVYDFDWFKHNIMTIRSFEEDKELEAMLMRQHIYIDYFDNIYVYDEKKRTTKEISSQRSSWAKAQYKVLLKNIYNLPNAIIHRDYDYADKIIQWLLMPRIVTVGITIAMSLILPFIYFSLVLKWWLVGLILGFAFSFATPNHMVGPHWDNDFLLLPVRVFTSLAKRVIHCFKK
jgi:cellulose synthase/poly-beta-1,6-N-acetylglucosamine synthase-like glycosyltransferase